MSDRLTSRQAPRTSVPWLNLLNTDRRRQMSPCLAGENEVDIGRSDVELSTESSFAQPFIQMQSPNLSDLVFCKFRGSNGCSESIARVIIASLFYHVPHVV